MRRGASVAVLGVFVFLLGTFCVSAAVLNVPTGAYPTIQDGINAAAAGDTVSVAPGNYYENVSMKSNVMLRGAGAGVTTITNPDPASAGTVTFDAVSNSSITGFAITGADFSEDAWGYRSAVFIYASDEVAVTNCRIIDNAATGVGAWSSTYVSVQGNLFENNSDVYCDGAALSSMQSSVIAERNYFTDNHNYCICSVLSLAGETYRGNVIRENSGLAIYLASSLATVDNNIILSNSIGGCGPGILCGGGVIWGGGVGPANRATVTRNLIAQNGDWGIWCIDLDNSTFNNNIIAEHTAYGLWVSGNSSPRFANNTIAGNGTGVCGSTSALWLFTNNIVAHNATYGLRCTTPVRHTYNDVWANGTDYSGGIAADATEVSVDPLFVYTYPDPYGSLDNLEFHVEPNSPVINAGDPAPAMRDPDGSQNEIGAYGGPRTKVCALNIISNPSSAAGVALSPCDAYLHNLSGVDHTYDVDVEVTDAAGTVVFTYTVTDTVTAGGLYVVDPIPVPALPAGEYTGRATMTDTSSGTVVGRDNFAFTAI